MTTENSHSPNIVKRFNEMLKQYGAGDIVHHMQGYFDDNEIDGFTEYLESKFNRFVVEYNIKSRTGYPYQKAYSAVVIPIEEFGEDTFKNMIANKQHDEYYLEQDLDGKRKNGEDVYYDRAWVITTKSEQEFVKYLEDRL